MTPKRRSHKNRDLPDNLYPTGHGFEYKHPISGKRYGVGSDRAKAIQRAKQLNAALSQQDRIVDAIMGGDTVSDVINRFRNEFLPDKKYSARSRSELDYRLARYDREFGNDAWESLTLKRISDFLSTLTRAAYIKHRGQWIDIYRFACSVGISERNLAELTLPKEQEPRKRKRWTDDSYKATYDVAPDWLKIAIRFAVTSLQRREDLVNVRKREDFVDGRMLVAQRKEGKRLAIKIEGTLADVIADAKAMHPFCPFVVGRKPERDRRGQKLHPYQVTPDYLTKAVAAARDTSGAFDGWPPGDRPTLHEFRSYGAHLYREAGYSEEYIQALLGHADAQMTRHYLDGHKIEWQEVEAGLRL